MALESSSAQVIATFAAPLRRNVVKEEPLCPLKKTLCSRTAETIQSGRLHSLFQRSRGADHDQPYLEQTSTFT
jgi:hypothetical protein